MFFGTFFGPVAVVIAFNIIMFILGVYVLIKSTRQKVIQADNRNNIKATVKLIVGICVIMVLFGVGWIFGALTFSVPSRAFQYLFVIFSVFQGFYFFIFVCLFGKDGRKFWVGLLRLKSFKKSITKSSHPNEHNYQSSTQNVLYSLSSKNTVLSSTGSSTGVVLKNPQRVNIELVPGNGKESEKICEVDENENTVSEHPNEVAMTMEVEKETSLDDTKEDHKEDIKEDQKSGGNTKRALKFSFILKTWQNRSKYSIKY